MEQDRRPDQAELQRMRESVAAKGGHTMLRSEVLRWNRRWSAGDLALLERHLGRVGAVRFRRAADGEYVSCVDPQNRLAMVIAPGYLAFPRHWVNDECAPDWPGVALSTFGVRSDPVVSSGAGRAPGRARKAPRGSTTRRIPEKEPVFCPRCFLQLTTTGTCPSCD